MKKFLSLFLVLVIALSLCACGDRSVSVTTVTESEKMSESQGGSSESDYNVNVLDSENGEVSIAVEIFGLSEVTISDVRDHLGSGFDSLNDDFMDNVVSICNFLSIDGLKRVMEFGRFPCGCMQEESLIVCYLCDIPYELAWKNGFHSQEDVEQFVAEFGI